MNKEPFTMTEEEYHATHVVNGMAWKIKPEYVSKATTQLQADYESCVKRFGYTFSTTKETGKALTSSKEQDRIAAILPRKQAVSL